MSNLNTITYSLSDVAQYTISEELRNRNELNLCDEKERRKNGQIK